MDLERPLHYRREGNVDQERGWRRSCLCTRILKVWRLLVKGKKRANREFQFVEVMGITVLANEVVRHFSNFTAKECWELAKRGWKLLILTHQSTCRDRIYKIGIARKHFFDEPASRGSR